MSIKIKLKKWIQKKALERGFYITNIRGGRDCRDCRKSLISFIERFKEKYIACDLVRIGNKDQDGGYLLPDILDKVNYCFSPGVGGEASFEQHLSNSYNIKSFMADASVKSPPLLDKNFAFIPKFLGPVTHGDFISLQDWIKQSVDDDTENYILQMDIEGSEYSVLEYVPSEVLSKFSILAVEFHGLENLMNTSFLQRFSTIFEKLYENFSICHVHPNNATGISSIYGVEVPHIMEVTFVRNDYCKELSNGKNISLPHKLDRDNDNYYKSIVMPDIWWKH